MENEKKDRALEEALDNYQEIYDKVRELEETIANARNEEKAELKETLKALNDVLETAAQKVADASPKVEENLPSYEEILEKDDDFKKEVVSNADKYGLDQRKIANIVISINDDDYKKEVLANAKQYGFSDYAISDIVNSVKDREFRQNAYDTSVLTYDPESKAFAAEEVSKDRTIDLKFTKEDTIESVAERLDSLVDEGIMTREQADNIFERVGEELHLAAREELAALEKENRDYADDKRANIELKDQLIKEDGAKKESVKGYGEAVRQISNKMSENEERIAALHKELESVPSEFDASSLFEEKVEKEETVEEKNEEPEENKEEPKEEEKEVVAEEVKPNIDYGNAEIVFNEGQYYPSKPGELSDEEIKHEMMEDYKRRMHLSDEDVKDLYIIRGMGAMEDGNGNVYEPYAVGIKEKENEEKVEYENQLLCTGTYALDSLPGAWKMSEAEVEEALNRRILEDVFRTHPEYREFEDELIVDRGADASDNGLTDGDQLGTYIIYRRVKKEVKVEEPEYEIIFNEGKYYQIRPGELSDEQIEQDMMEDYKLMMHLSDEDVKDLHIIRGMGAMEDGNGNIYEPYAVGRKIVKEETEEVNQDEAVEEVAVEEQQESTIEELQEELDRLRAERDKLIEETASKDDKEVETEVEVDENAIRLQEIEEKLAAVQQEVESLIADYEENINKMNNLIKDLQEALDNEDYKGLKDVNAKIIELKETNGKLKDSIKEAKSSLESLQEEREMIQTDILAKETLTPEEYREITNTLRNKNLVRQILKQKGVYDIYRKGVEERTPEEQDQIRSALREAIDEVANAKLENRDASVLDLVQALYNIESEVKKGTDPNEVELSSQEAEVLAKNANGLPAAVANREATEPDYEPEKAPEDMQEVMAAQENGASEAVEEPEYEYEDEEIYTGKYVMDSIPGASKMSEEETDEIIRQRMLDIMYNEHPEYRDIDPEELVVIPGDQASDVDEDGNVYDDVQVTPFTVVRRTKKEKEKEDKQPVPPVIPDPDPKPTPPNPDPKQDPDDDDPDPDGDDDDKEDDEDKEEEIEANLYTALAKLKKGLKNKPKDFSRLQRSKATVLKDFATDLRTKRVEYNVFGVVPAAGKALFRGVGKYLAEIWSILDGGRVEKMAKQFKENWENLTEEEKQIIFDKYKGNEIQQLKLIGLNDIILPELVSFGMAKVEKLNDNIRNNYGILLESLKILDELGERLDAGKLTEEEYDIARAKLMSQAATAVEEIMRDRAIVNETLDSGIHGIQEDFKAVRSKMIYAGYRWAKAQEFTEEELEELGRYRGKMKSAIKNGDPESVVDNFMKMEGVFMDNTEIKKGILGERSVGKAYYMPIAEEFDYRGDPFIRNVIMTATALTSLYGMYNAYRTHQQVGEAEEHLRDVDAENVAGAKRVTDTAQHQIDQSDELAKATEAQAYADGGGLAGIGERYGIDRTSHDGGGWDFSRYDDTDVHEWYNGVVDNATKTLAENQRRFNAGELSNIQYLRANQDVLRDLAETRHQFISEYMPLLQEYARNNNYDLDAFLKTFEYELGHHGAVGEGLDSISTIMDDAESLLDYTVATAAGKLPDDFLSTMLGLGTAQVLFGKIAKDQETKVKKKYGNEVIDAMQERRQKDLEEMVEEHVEREAEAKEDEMEEDVADAIDREMEEHGHSR